MGFHFIRQIVVPGEGERAHLLVPRYFYLKSNLYNFNQSIQQNNFNQRIYVRHFFLFNIFFKDKSY